MPSIAIAIGVSYGRPGDSTPGGIANTYAQPGGVFTYRAPGGIDLYLQP